MKSPRATLLLSFLTIFLYHGRASDPVDSLLNVLNYETNDTVRMSLMIRLGDFLVDQESLDSAYDFYDQVISFTREKELNNYHITA
ncbi:MAG TPA: hypothetical protein VKA10_00955, partial [Prolixibacteraceae bacterium]|nr:hypothetical protein [Prolixibacteraceae bacterium]